MLLGTEPSRGWKTFATEVIDALAAAGIDGIVFLGAMLADVPHTRPISIFATSENEALRDRFELEKSTYEGPVGILSVLGDAAERAEIPTLSIWASVPHYVHNAPSPKATLALIERLEEFVDVDRRPRLARRGSAAWVEGIDALASDDDDMAAYIAQLEQARDTVDSPEASGDAIAEEFERYLRRREGPRAAPPARPGARQPEHALLFCMTASGRKDDMRWSWPCIAQDPAERAGVCLPDRRRAAERDSTRAAGPRAVRRTTRRSWAWNSALGNLQKAA